MLTRKLVVLIAALLFAWPLQAAQQTIFVGTPADKKSLDTNFGNAQANFVELYGWVNQGVKTTSSPSFVSVTATGGTLRAGVAGTTQGALVLHTNTDPIYTAGFMPAASPTAIVAIKFPPAPPAGANYLWNVDADGTGGWTDPATFTDDQTAAEVPVTDAGGYFTGADIESVLQEIGPLTDAVELTAGTNITITDGVISATGGGSFTPDTFPAYEDSARTSGIAWNSTTLAVYDTGTSKWLTAALADTLDPAPSSYAVEDDFSSDTTANYTNILQTLSISGGAAHGTSWENTAAYHETPTGSNDHYVSATCTIDSTGYDAACLILGSNGTTAYGVRFEGGTLYVFSIPGGYNDSYAGGYAAGTHSVVAQIDTDAGHARLKIWVDGTLALTNTDTADVVTRGQYIGMFFDRGSSNEDVTVDNLIANPGAYTP